jgi:hypothetical protein
MKESKMLSLRRAPLALSLFLFITASSLHQAYADDQNPLTLEFVNAEQTDFAQGAASEFGSDDHASKGPSKWEDIKSWKSVGNRFAAAYDINKNLIAIYDLSYPGFFGRVALGEVGTPDVSSDVMSQAFNGAVGDIDSSDLSDGAKSAILALGSAPQTVLGTQVFPANWWKSIPWVQTAPSDEPDQFKITDLDLKKLKIGSSIVSGLRNLFQAVLDDQDGVAALSDTQILEAFEFVHMPSGGYQLAWSDPRTASKAVSNPRKLLDFNDAKSGLYRNIEVQAIVSGLSEATNLIPIPVVGALVSTAISRVGRYHVMIQTEHLEMLHEVAIESTEGSITDAVIAAFNSAETSDLINSFELARVSAFDSWKWIFGSPLSAWNKEESADATCSTASHEWFEAHDDVINDLNSRFSVVITQQGQRSLYLNSNTCPKTSTATKGPMVSINYDSPDQIAKHRILLESVGVGVEFASHFVPYAGFIIQEAYTLLVQNKLDNAQIWEARLMQHLEQRPDPQGTWNFEFSTLQNQRMNPFEISHQQMLDLVAARSAALGL